MYSRECSVTHMPDCHLTHIMQVANDHNTVYHRHQRKDGYSVADELPKNAQKYIQCCLKILRAQICLCLSNKVDLDDVKKGKPGSGQEPANSQYRRVVSSNLGEYPYSYVSTRTSKSIKSLVQCLCKGRVKMKKYPVKAKGFGSLHTHLINYCSASEGDTVFPFASENKFGMSIASMKQAFDSLT